MFSWLVVYVIIILHNTLKCITIIKIFLITWNSYILQVYLLPYLTDVSINYSAVDNTIMRVQYYESWVKKSIVDCGYVTLSCTLYDTMKIPPTRIILSPLQVDVLYRVTIVTGWHTISVWCLNVCWWLCSVFVFVRFHSPHDYSAHLDRSWPTVLRNLPQNHQWIKLIVEQLPGTKVWFQRICVEMKGCSHGAKDRLK